MTSTARLALVAQLDAQIVKRLDRLTIARAHGVNTRMLELATLSLVERAATELRPGVEHAGRDARAHAAYLMATGRHAALRTRYTATA